MTYRNEFWVEDSFDGKSLRLRQPLTSDLLSELGVVAESITELRAWWKTDVGDIGLLMEFPQLRRLQIINRTDQSINAIDRLVVLQTLFVDSNAPFDADFASWPKLQETNFTWNGKVRNLERAVSLETIVVKKWKMTDLSALQNLVALESIGIIGGSLRSLVGIEKCSKLTDLTLSHLPKLMDFSTASRLRNLRCLHIDTCRRLDSVEPFADLPHLRILRIDNGGSVDSLRPLLASSSLRELYFIESTCIVDGDTAIVKEMNLDDFGFANRAHYNYNYDHVRGHSG
jgi:hypothetical protein